MRSPVKEWGERLAQALVVAGLCAAVFFWSGKDHDGLATIAFLVGCGALLVAAVSALALVLGGLAYVTEQPGRLVRDRRRRIESAERDARYRLEAAERDARRAKLEASRERHRAHRMEWVRNARDRIDREGPPWTGDNRDAFVWLRARVGKTVTIRERHEDRMLNYHWGYTGYRANIEPAALQAPTEWSSQSWVVELPDSALNPAEVDDHLDETRIEVSWKIPGASLPSSRVAVDAKGIEIRFPGNDFNDVNDLDYGYSGTYTRVVRIEEPD